MFAGGGFGVGLTVNQLDLPPWPPETLPAGVEAHPTRLGELMPVDARSDAELAHEMRRANVADSRLWAYRVEMIAALAKRRGDDRDRAPEQSGSAGTGWARLGAVPAGLSEFFADELALVLDCSRAAAAELATVALTLAHRLPETWAALADGELSWARARAIAREVDRHGPELDPHLLATVEAVVLPQAPELSVHRLQALVRAEIVRRDAHAADRRREQAQASADVLLRRSANEGMAEVVTVLPQPVAAAVYRAVDAHARQAKVDGDPRPIGRIRAEVSAALTLRPWDETRPPVTAELWVIAPLNSLLPDPSVLGEGGSPPGIALVDDEPITAGHLRALLTALDAVCPGGLQSPTGGARCTSICSAGAARCSSRSPVGSSSRRCAVAAPPTPTGTAAAPWWNGRRRSTATSPPRPSAGGPGPGTGSAGTPAARTGPGGRTSTTSRRTPTEGGPTAPTSVACAVGTTGSRPMPRAGASTSTPTVPCG